MSLRKEEKIVVTNPEGEEVEVKVRTDQEIYEQIKEERKNQDLVLFTLLTILLMGFLITYFVPEMMII